MVVQVGAEFEMNTQPFRFVIEPCPLCACYDVVWESMGRENRIGDVSRTLTRNELKLAGWLYVCSHDHQRRKKTYSLSHLSLTQQRCWFA